VAAGAFAGVRMLNHEELPIRTCFFLTVTRRPASKRRQILKRGGWARDFARVKGRMAKLIKTPIEPITCPHCGGQAYLMRRTLHPKIKGEIWTFECKNCGKQTEKSKLHYTDVTE
jgi:ribosomal protein L37AE/L43A